MLREQNAQVDWPMREDLRAHLGDEEAD